MMKSKLLNSLILAAFAAPGMAMAADPAPAAPAAPTLSSVLDASGISLSGDIDLSYSHLSGTGAFINPSSSSSPGLNDRVFDYAHDGFTTQAIDVAVSKLPAEGYGGSVELTMGKDASTIASYGTGIANQTFDITQAFIQYATGNWTAIAGKFNTLAGAEVIKASGNTNFSRSILFGYAIPFTHTGARVSYKVSDAVSLIGGVNNGWDQATDANPNKTIELGAALNPTKSFALTVQDYLGTEQSTGLGSGLDGKRNLFDLVATFTASDSLNFVLNYDNGSQQNAMLADGTTGTAKWHGVAGYANYQINDLWRVSARAEVFNDTDGYRTGIVYVSPTQLGGQKWKEATLTVGYAPTKSVELRGELRKDTSDQPVFAYADAIGPRKYQSSVGLEAVYKF